ncbi:hypothetical protein PIGHUM_03956 [Pigmentiphaga humi]|uniref:Uncharacterized protein n=1 Tax=Pigmentiphaga humi TaxID=2478468 RepID=A0A3P4B9Q3_9BURK|nr:DUF6157 family protein [Pigmentiphaga humi]VCU71865.1 hypothetical protein PIGHUM_03956 [Pigmentiphaga humi]
MTTNYVATFITVSPDSTVTMGQAPSKAGSTAQIQHQLLTAQPYYFTSDELLFEVHAIRQGIAPEDRARAREAFFAKPQACLRASPLVKQFGWGVHHDADSKIAAYGIETDAYRELSTRKDLKIVAGMRSQRQPGGSLEK